MNTLSSVRRRVDAIRRKLAVPLAILRLHRLANEFSLEWTVAIADRQPRPESHPFILRVAAAGFRLTTFMEVRKYLEGCRSQNTLPETYKLLRALLPCHIPLVPAYLFADLSPQ